MPQQTIDPPEADEKSRIDRDWDREFNGIVDGNKSDETGRTQGDYDKEFNNLTDGLRQKESGTANRPDKQQSVADREKTPASTWKNSTSAGGSKNDRPQFVKAKLITKRFGPTGIITSIFIGLITGTTLTVGPASLLVNIKENIVESFDQQSVSAESRSNKILSSRTREIVNETSSGLCGKIKLACRYQKPSERLLRRMEKEGITAYDKNGNKIERQALIGFKTRPASYSIDGGKNFIAADDFVKEMKNNPELRRVFRRAYNPRWANWFDDTSAKFLKKIGISKDTNDSLKGKKNAGELDEAATKMMTTQDEGKATVNTRVEEQTSVFAEREGKKASKMGKGDIFLIGAGVACAAAKVPVLISSILRKYRLAQISLIAFNVLTVADKIKSGDATADEVNNVATLMTQVAKLSDGTTTKSATDSPALHYALGLGRGGGDSKYLPRVGKFMAGYTELVKSGPVSGVCNALSSSEAQAALSTIKAMKSTFEASNPVGWGMAVMDGVGLALDKSGLMDDIVKSLVSKVADLFNSLVDWSALMEQFMGNYAAKARYSELGDVVAIGTSSNMADLANIGGNAPLTPSQKVAYDNDIANPIKLAWAEEDRATLSPFDASSPHTVLGSITTKLIPYQTSFQTPLGALSAIANISLSSFSNFLSPNKAKAASDSDWKMCEADYLIANSGVAAGPLCDVQYGVPSDYMGIEPETVIQELSNADQINDEGEPKKDSDLENWIMDCSSADTTSLSVCSVDDRTKALYALYQIDKRIIDGMDNEPSSSSSTTSGSTSAPSGEAVGEPEYDQAQPEADRAAGKEVWPGKNNGKFSDSDLLALSFSPNTDPDLDKRMYTQAAKAMEEMNKAYHEETGGNLEIREGYRSYDRQLSYYNQGLTKADPGTSNHGWGLAADLGVDAFDSAIYLWLKANAPKYGFINPDWAKNRANPLWYRDEPWHWEYARKVY